MAFTSSEEELEGSGMLLELGSSDELDSPSSSSLELSLQEKRMRKAAQKASKSKKRRFFIQFSRLY
jgi:hypothetical protein